MDIKIIDCSFHRNGVGGVGFYAVLFDDPEQGRMIASLFDKSGYCAIYKVEELSQNNVQFANGNSWRGDVYEEKLRPLVKAFMKKNGNRIGPFAFPMKY